MRPYDVEIREVTEPRWGRTFDSWAPRPRRKRRPLVWRLRNAIRAVLSWTMLLALAIGLQAIVLEPALLFARGAPLSACLLAPLAAIALATPFSLMIAVPLALVRIGVRAIARLRAPCRHAWPLALVALAWVVVVVVAPHPFATEYRSGQARPILVALFASVLILSTLLTRIANPSFRVSVTALLGAAMMALFLRLPPILHDEPRDLMWLLCVVSTGAALYPIHRRLSRAPHERVARWFGALVVASLAAGLVVGAAPSDWRVYAKDFGAFAERLARFCRTVADLDGDGFSAVLGGRDCADLDDRRNPGVRERADGVDRNCNGRTRPASPTEAERGLAPPAGDPDAAAGAIDRVVLVTVDCLRADAMTPDVMPNVSRLAARGVLFTRAYAGAARTATSLPLLLRGAYGQPAVAEILGAEGVTSAAVFAYRHPTIGNEIFQGFGAVSWPDANDKRLRATDVTDMALADLGATAGRGPHLAWVHYFDLHGPRTLRVLPPDVRRFAPLPGEEDESALYLSGAAYVDAEVGRLVEGIERTGGFERTVVLLTSDHGEAFGAHATHEHGQSPFDEVLHVPAVVVAPGLAPRRYDHVVSHRDVAATILGAFAQAARHGEAAFGRSWLRLRAAPEAPLHLFAMTYSVSTHVYTWASDPLLVRTDDHAKFSVAYKTGIERLYHLDSPERETRSLVTRFSAEAARDRAELETFRDIDAPPP